MTNQKKPPFIIPCACCNYPAAVSFSPIKTNEPVFCIDCANTITIIHDRIFKTEKYTCIRESYAEWHWKTNIRGQTETVLNELLKHLL